MKHYLNSILVFSILLIITLGCSSTESQKISTDNKTAPAVSFASTPEVSVNPVVTETPTKKKIQITLEVAKAATIISEDASLRKTGSQDGEVFDVIPKGTSVEVLKQKGKWFFVRVDEKTGWMHGDNLRYGNAPVEVYNAEPEDYSPPIPSYSSTSPVPTTESVKDETDEPTSVTRYSPTPETYTPKIYTPQPSTDRVAPTVVSSVPTAICADGTTSYSANRPGTCSHHGGVADWLDGSSSNTKPSDETTSSPGYSADSNYRPKTVNVRGYTRKDGTYVAPHTRSAPRRRN